MEIAPFDTYRDRPIYVRAQTRGSDQFKMRAKDGCFAATNHARRTSIETAAWYLTLFLGNILYARHRKMATYSSSLARDLYRELLDRPSSFSLATIAPAYLQGIGHDDKGLHLLLESMGV